MNRIIVVFGGGCAVLIAMLLFSLTQGQEVYAWTTVWEALFRPQDTLEHNILLSMRLPRAVMAVLGGAALAVAGVLLQTLTRNPLASAGTFGINAGAFFVIILSAVFFPALKANVPFLLAFLGGAGAACLSYLLAGGKRGTPVRMALAGMIVTLVLSSFTSTLQLLFENETNGLFIWGSGSLVQNDWQGVRLSWLWIVIPLAAAMLYTRSLDMMELNEEVAGSLGHRVNAARFAALAGAVLLASVTVSVVGPIGFVGLIAPHLVRLIGLHRHRWLIPGSALWGANALLIADSLARMFRSVIGELPAGVVTAVIGAPWLIWLAVREKPEESRPVGEGGSMAVGVVRHRVSFPVLIGLSVILLALLILISLSVGGVRVPLAGVFQTLIGQGEEMHRNLILQLRLPRIAVAGLAGAALAAAGATLQGAVRNPLADPSIIGVTSGAGVGALLMIVVFPAASAGWLPVAAAAGAILAAAAVYLLALRRSFQPAVLILVGIAVTAINSAVIHFLVIRSGMGAAPALAWLAGSTYARGWSQAAILLPVLLVLLPAAWWMGRRIDLLAFGDQTSLGLGLRLQQTRLLAAGVGVVLAAAAVSAVGTIGFIGLMAPHAARVIAGQSYRRNMLLSAMIGAILLVAADGLGRAVLAPKEIPAGLVTAVIGTPYLLLLILRNRPAVKG
ncbi:iron ABC transporter permease [Paenibacillus sp. CN-4]|uniref:iron ABC transporter permease n=1 Tax=Paenibacillus nanchangensis TaxID=3348343 RepID=UPI00397951B9